MRRAVQSAAFIISGAQSSIRWRKQRLTAGFRMVDATQSPAIRGGFAEERFLRTQGGV